MTRRTGSLVLGAIAALAVSSAAQAQSVFFGGGVTIPMGGFKDEAKTGWLATGGVTVDIGSKGAFFDGELFYGSNSHKNTTTYSERTNLAAGIGALGFEFGKEGQKVRPYVLAGAGILNHQFKTSSPSTLGGSSKSLAYTGAAGLIIALSSKASFWVEGRYLAGTGDNSDTKVLPFMVGLAINVGK